jgi:hypothetical protein
MKKNKLFIKILSQVVNKYTLSLCFIFNSLVSLAFQNEAQHPQIENIPYINNSEISIISNHHIADTIVFKRLNNLFNSNNYTLEFQLGQSGNSINDFETELFGEITSIFLDRNKSILALDNRKNTFSIFDSLGNYKQSVSRGGRGPGDLQDPTFIDYDIKGNVYINDRYLRIKKFKMDGTSYEYERDLDVKINTRSFCTLNENIYINRSKPQAGLNNIQELFRVHVYTQKEGKYLFSFGEVYNGENWLVTDQMSRGKIFCDKNSKSILITFRYMPYIFSFSHNGKLKWITKFDDSLFITMPRESGYEDGVPYIVNFGAEGFSDVNNILSIDSEYFLVQIINTPASKNNSENTFTSFYINKNDGTGSQLNDLNPLWKILNVHNSTLYVDATLPNKYPSLNVFKKNN